MKRLWIVLLTMGVVVLVGQDGGCQEEDGDGDGWTTAEGDCDDRNADTHPGAEEICDNRDNDCDEEIDEGVALTTFYADADGDGYGDSATTEEACSASFGYVENAQDCDDGDAAIYPGTEGCDFLSCADIKDTPSDVGDGLYTIDPDGGGTDHAPMSVYCYLTGDVGWTRVFSLQLSNSSCVVYTYATDQDPADEDQSCAKYSDDLINLLAREKTFMSQVDSYDPLFSKYSDAYNTDGTPGTVISQGTYDEIAIAEPTYTIGYSAWVSFHQENWYNSDRCLGAPDYSYRLSLEYIGGSARCVGCAKYACNGPCDEQCWSVTSGQTHVYVR